MLDVSSDSVFLLAACEDNQLYLHSLATGTEIHSLRGHKAEVRPLTCNRRHILLPSQLINEFRTEVRICFIEGSNEKLHVFCWVCKRLYYASKKIIPL
jgi:uncharacterized protein YjhX (UPF0386 family)